MRAALESLGRKGSGFTPFRRSGNPDRREAERAPMTWTAAFAADAQHLNSAGAPGDCGARDSQLGTPRLETLNKSLKGSFFETTTSTLPPSARAETTRPAKPVTRALRCR